MFTSILVPKTVGWLTCSTVQDALAPHTSTLRLLSLAACASVTDAALEAVPPGVKSLSLVCCERVTGQSLIRLSGLRSLRLAGCPAIEPAAVQARAASSSSGYTCLQLGA